MCATLRSRSSVLGRTAVCACDHRTHRPHTGCYQRVITGRTVLLPGCDQRVTSVCALLTTRLGISGEMAPPRGEDARREPWRGGRGATAQTAHTREAALSRGGNFSPARVEKPPHTPAILWMSQAVSAVRQR